MQVFSYVAVTHEIDDVDAGIKELLQGIGEAYKGRKNNCGLVFCDSDMEHGELMHGLSAALGFEIIGCTAVATIENTHGFHELSITLMVLSADDCTFATAVSEPVRALGSEQVTADACDQLVAKLGAKPALVIALPAYTLDVMLDTYTSVFAQKMPGVPVVGGLPSFHNHADRNLTVHNAQVYTDRLVMLGIAGNVRPVFHVATVMGVGAERKRVVTSAKDNTVYRVGEQTFIEHLLELGLPVQKMMQGNSNIAFASIPIMLETGSGATYASFLRTLHNLNLEEGSGTAVGNIPQGALLTVCSLERSTIQKSAAAGGEALGKLIEEAQTPQYQYSTVLAFSCIGRYLVMTPKSSVEIDTLLEHLPKGDYALAGFYGYGEIGPRGTGNLEPFAHNEAMVLCAF